MKRASAIVAVFALMLAGSARGTEPSGAVLPELPVTTSSPATVQQEYATGTWTEVTTNPYGGRANTMCGCRRNAGPTPCCGVDFGCLWADYCLDKQRHVGCGPSCGDTCRPATCCGPARCNCGHHTLLGPSTWRRLRGTVPSSAAGCCDRPAVGCDQAAPAGPLPTEPPQLGAPPTPPTPALAPAPPAESPVPVAPANRSTRRGWLRPSTR